MNSVISPGFPVIYHSDWQGESPISASNPQIISKLLTLGYTEGFCIQLLVDGTADVNYTFQYTLMPFNFGQFGYTVFGTGVRDDSYASPMWDQLPNSSGTITAGRKTLSLFAGDSKFAFGRLLLTYSAGGSSKVTAVVASTSGQ